MLSQNTITVSVSRPTRNVLGARSMHKSGMASDTIRLPVVLLGRYAVICIVPNLGTFILLRGHRHDTKMSYLYSGKKTDNNQ